MPVQAPAEGFATRVTRALEAFSWQPRAETIAQLNLYCALAVAWNQRVDLTAARSPDELVDLLLADAIAITAASGSITPNELWLDVGSGVGAPGIPLALLSPIRMTLVEPREKRVAFLRTAVGSLARPDIIVRRSRSDQLSEDSCGVAVSRATLPPAEWLIEGTRLAVSRVWLLLAKAELPDLGAQRILADVRYRWPLTGVERRAVCVSTRVDPADA